MASDFDITVLRAIHNLGEPYGVPLQAELTRVIGKEASFTRMYAACDRLELSELITSWHGEATPERGYRAKRHFKVLDAGIKYLTANAALIYGQSGKFLLSSTPA